MGLPPFRVARKGRLRPNLVELPDNQPVPVFQFLQTAELGWALSRVSRHSLVLLKRISIRPSSVPPVAGPGSGRPSSCGCPISWCRGVACFPKKPPRMAAAARIGCPTSHVQLLCGQCAVPLRAGSGFEAELFCCCAVAEEGLCACCRAHGRGYEFALLPGEVYVDTSSGAEACD